jgi:hypothetical protein
MNRINEIFEAGYKLYNKDKASIILENLLSESELNRKKALMNVKSAFVFPYYLKKYKKAGVELSAFVSDKDIYEFRLAVSEALVEAEAIDDRLGVLFSEREVPFETSTVSTPVIDGKGIAITDITKGNRIKFSNISGTEAKINMIELATGIEAKIDLLRSGNYAAFLDILQLHRVKLFNSKYEKLGKLIKQVAEQRASSGEQVLYDTTGATQTEKDINTLNEAVIKLKNDNTDIVGNITEAVLLIPSNAQLLQRVRVALNTITPIPGITSSVFIGTYPIQVIDTNQIEWDNNNTAYLVVPGLFNKLYVAINDDTAESLNVQHFTVSWATRIKFGAGILNKNQVLKVNLA